MPVSIRHTRAEASQDASARVSRIDIRFHGVPALDLALRNLNPILLQSLDDRILYLRGHLFR